MMVKHRILHRGSNSDTFSLLQLQNMSSEQDFTKPTIKHFSLLQNKPWVLIEVMFCLLECIYRCHILTTIIKILHTEAADVFYKSLDFLVLLHSLIAGVVNVHHFGNEAARRENRMAVTDRGSSCLNFSVSETLTPSDNQGYQMAFLFKTSSKSQIACQKRVAAYLLVVSHTL